MSGLADILLNGTSPDSSVRIPAENQLKQAEAQNFPAYLVELCKILGNEQAHINARQLAGLLLKNCVVAKDETQKRLLFERWLALADNVRGQVKSMVLAILGSAQKNARSTASLVISKIAAVEVPQGKWDNLVDLLVANVRNENQNLRQASFEALGYVCEECPQNLQSKSDPILNAIASGLAQEEKNEQIKLAATVALANSLEFVKNNFANQSERNLIMQMVFSAAQCSDIKVRVAAYQCLVAIATLYYGYLGEYITYIFNMTSQAIQKEDEEVAQQAIEFWCTICDEEIEINDEIEEAKSRSQQPPRQCGGFMNSALKDIMPLVLVSLTKQSDELDDETWNIAKSAALCIGLVAETTTNNIVAHVLPFVQNNIKNQNWRFREAAVLAFGYMLEGPDRTGLTPYVQGAFPVLLGHMQDQSELVKDTTAWTLGRVCDLFAIEIVNPQTLPQLMQVLVAGLKETPSIARNVCWAIHNLASAISLTENQQTSFLSQYFTGLVQALLVLSERLDEPKLMSAAFTTINVLVQSAAKDVINLVGQLLPTLLGRLQGTFATMQNCNAAQMAIISDVQAHLCGALQVMVDKIDDSILVQHCDNLMGMFLQVLQTPNSTVHEEAIHAIGEIANRLGPRFEKYMEHFKPFLLQGLNNAQDHHVCSNCVGALSAVAHALSSKLAPICDEFMSILLQNLQNPQIDRSVKPQIISCLADIAFATGGFFARYLQYVMVMLVQASSFSFGETLDFENLEYLNLLRESILEAYACMLQSLGTDQKAMMFVPYLEKLHPFLDVISKDSNRGDKVLKGAIGLLGDLAAQLGASAGPLLQTPCCQLLIQAGQQSQNAKIQQISVWSRERITKVLS